MFQATGYLTRDGRSHSSDSGNNTNSESTFRDGSALRYMITELLHFLVHLIVLKMGYKKVQQIGSAMCSATQVILVITVKLEKLLSTLKLMNF